MLLALAAGAQRPPQNLKLLQPEEVRATMRAYRTGLGVRCEFCHVQGNDASDEKPQKLTARKMIAMTQEINAKFPDTSKVHVSCYTCHRGVGAISTVEGKMVLRESLRKGYHIAENREEESC